MILRHFPALAVISLLAVAHPASAQDIKVGLIAGCFVTDGIIKRNVKVRLARDGKVIHTGKVATLRREKDDVRDVRAGFECGLTLQDYQDLKEGDVLEFMQVEMVKRTLGSV